MKTGERGVYWSVDSDGKKYIEVFYIFLNDNPVRGFLILCARGSNLLFLIEEPLPSVINFDCVNALAVYINNKPIRKSNDLRKAVRGIRKNDFLKMLSDNIPINWVSGSDDNTVKRIVTLVSPV